MASEKRKAQQRASALRNREKNRDRLNALRREKWEETREHRNALQRANYAKKREREESLLPDEERERRAAFLERQKKGISRRNAKAKSNLITRRIEGVKVSIIFTDEIHTRLEGALHTFSFAVEMDRVIRESVDDYDRYQMRSIEDEFAIVDDINMMFWKRWNSERGRTFETTINNTRLWKAW